MIISITSRVYELGLIISSAVPEEEVAFEFGKVRAVLESTGGLMLAEEFPVRTNVQYPMSKNINGKIYKFTSGYFGWMRIEVDPAGLSEIRNILYANEKLLRFIFVRMRRAYEPREREINVAAFSEKPADTVKRHLPLKGAEHSLISDEELNKSIEELVIE